MGAGADAGEGGVAPSCGGAAPAGCEATTGVGSGGFDTVSDAEDAGVLPALPEVEVGGDAAPNTSGVV